MKEFPGSCGHPAPNSIKCRQDRGPGCSPQQYTSSPKHLALPLFKCILLLFLHQCLGLSSCLFHFFERESLHVFIISSNISHILSYLTKPISRDLVKLKTLNFLAKNKISRYPPYIITFQNPPYFPSTSKGNSTGAHMEY